MKKEKSSRVGEAENNSKPIETSSVKAPSKLTAFREFMLKNPKKALAFLEENKMGDALEDPPHLNEWLTKRIEDLKNENLKP